MIERITLHTQDGVQIIGTWRTPSVPILGTIICLHGFQEDRHVWRAWQEEWEKDGIASLAIDLRGHGESIQTQTGTIDAKSLNEAQHAESLKDVQSAVTWIKSQIQKPIALIGSSIGANLAIQALATDATIRGAILLSPGLNYHGIKTEAAMRKLQEKQVLWLIASEGDDQESADAAQTLAGSVEGPYIQLELLTHAGHGTTMSKTHPELLTQTCQWFQDLLSS